jgi:hypothetical protein
MYVCMYVCILAVRMLSVSKCLLSPKIFHYIYIYSINNSCITTHFFRSRSHQLFLYLLAKPHLEAVTALVHRPHFKILSCHLQLIHQTAVFGLAIIRVKMETPPSNCVVSLRWVWSLQSISHSPWPQHHSHLTRMGIFMVNTMINVLFS